MQDRSDGMGGKLAMVTGAGSGQGFGTALALVRWARCTMACTLAGGADASVQAGQDARRR